MSDGTEQPEETPVEEAGEQQRGMSDRTAKVVLSVVALGAAWGLLVAAPWLAYVVVGVMASLGWQKAAAWRQRRAGGDTVEDEPEEAPVDIVGALQDLSEGGRHVLLTELRDATKAADTKAVRALLAEAGVRVRPGVRSPAGNGPGVHQDDIPAPSPTAESGHGEGCCCSSGAANDNANNSGEGSPEEGVRVERFGPGGYIIRDPADSVRHHRVK